MEKAEDDWAGEAGGSYAGKASGAVLGHLAISFRTWGGISEP